MENVPTRPRIILVAQTLDYRQVARETLTTEDVFLEIGCAGGECTTLLAKDGFKGLALDHTPDLVARAAERVAHYPQITVAELDARDIAELQRLCPRPTVILVDIGGTEALDKVASLLRLLFKSFRPRLYIVKSRELALLADMIQEVHLPDRPPAISPLEMREVQHQLIDLSHSSVINDRLFALKRLRSYLEKKEVLERVQQMTADESNSVRRLAQHTLRHYETSDEPN
ncbi:MAG: class I SAM-dependent methyltransferase [Chloroflexi bacterium]|nr:class I SAM-dependent methyltransferase [Chloroflexota bacterium]